jgi:hypothetical protein
LTNGSKSRLADQLLRKFMQVSAAEISEALGLYGDKTGNNIYRHAGRIISGAVPVAAKDDSKAIEKIQAYPPHLRHNAAAEVAHEELGPRASKKQIETAAHRYRRKLRKQKRTPGPSASSAA